MNPYNRFSQSIVGCHPPIIGVTTRWMLSLFTSRHLHLSRGRITYPHPLIGHARIILGHSTCDCAIPLVIVRVTLVILSCVIVSLPVDRIRIIDHIDSDTPQIPAGLDAMVAM